MHYADGVDGSCTISVVMRYSTGVRNCSRKEPTHASYNNRPRSVLGFRTPKEVFDQMSLKAQAGAIRV